ncbi:unnamed protein product [Dovyalis caffra]|uniref:Uncharacterized protein n=1 Tax=Dovyalis caffra TaxID=77055 RepID=A0AAV1SSA8_9ROSI|nr:unnamed protein product [Dovyalis caffra]
MKQKERGRERLSKTHEQSETTCHRQKVLPAIYTNVQVIKLNSKLFNERHVSSGSG